MSTTVAFAGCWHGNIHVGKMVLRAIKEKGITTLIHTGDFLFTYPSAGKFLKEIQEECEKLGMTIIAIRGNHDNPEIFRNLTLSTQERKAEGEVFEHPFAEMTKNILHAPDGLRWTWEGVELGALGGAKSIDWRARRLGIDWWMDEVTEVPAIESMIDGGKIDVLIMHDVPSSVPLHFADRSEIPTWWDLEAAEEHRIPLQRAVDATRPQYVISGHMHAQQVAQGASYSHEFTSIILDRGDYKAGTPSNDDISRNLIVGTFDQGQVSFSEF